MHHAQHIQVEPIEHKGESRLVLMFPFEKQLTARARTMPNVRWSVNTTILTDFVTLPDFLKPASCTRLSSPSSDKAGITIPSTAAQGRLWHKVDIYSMTSSLSSTCLFLSTSTSLKMLANAPHCLIFFALLRHKVTAHLFANHLPLSIAPAQEARRESVSDARDQHLDCVTHAAIYLPWSLSCTLHFCQKVRPEQRKCADITELCTIIGKT